MVIFLRKNRMLCVILCGIILLGTLGNQKVYGEESLSMYSGSYALTDARNHRVLAGKKETTPMANASTTKILTCIVALENCKLTEQVKISPNAAKQPKVRLGVKAGEVYEMKDMLYALMLESYNDCAVAIAEHVGGSAEGFAKLLNAKAKEIGCRDTYFITPNGLDEEDEISFHHTTAEDLCKIMSYCVWESPQKDVFLEITQTRNYKSYVNRNTFLDQMDGVISGKTGYTSKAGYCYVAAFERDGERFCIALLACGWPNNQTYKWKDSRVLLTYGIEKYDLINLKEEKLEETIKINGSVGSKKFENLNQSMMLKVSGEGGLIVALASDDERIEKEVILYTDTNLPVKEGQKLGECNYYIDGMLLLSISLYAEESASVWSFADIAKSVLWKYLSFSSQTS